MLLRLGFVRKLLTALGLVLAGGGMTPAAIPWIEIVVVQSDGDVKFEFYRAEKEGQLLKEQARVDRLAVYMHERGPMKWRIITLEPSKMTTHIVYGSLPEGFSQEIPPQGAAPPLEPNLKYSVSVGGEGVGVASFVYQGR